jgi:hypothetical protein
MSARRHAFALALAVFSVFVGACENELRPDDPGVELDFGGDDALEDEGALMASPACSKEAILARAPNDERLWSLAVAHRWIDLGVTYDRGRTFEGHRRDCSGFVSMAWGLPKPGASTAMMEPFSNHPETFEIPINDLIPGDAVNRRTRRQASDGSTVGHIRLFGGWVDKAAGTHCILEYYSTGRVGRAMLGTRADLADYIGLRRNGLPIAPRGGTPSPPSPTSPVDDAAAADADSPGCGVLAQHEALAPHELKRSCDGRFTLVHQGDGNVVLYDQGGRALWNTRTAGQATSSFVMQGDGNLVLYRADGRALWHSQTHGNPTSATVLRDDGNLVVYGANWRVLWQSDTGRP